MSHNRKAFYFRIMAVLLMLMALGFYLLSEYKSEYLKVPPEMGEIFQNITSKEIYCLDDDVLEKRWIEWKELYNDKDPSYRVQSLLMKGELQSYINHLILRRDSERTRVLREAFLVGAGITSNNECLSPFFVSMLSADTESFRLMAEIVPAETLKSNIEGDFYMYGIYFCDRAIFELIVKNHEFYDRIFWESIKYSPLRFAAIQCPDFLPILRSAKHYKPSFLEKILAQ